MIYPDTSFLIPLYTRQPRTVEASEYMDSRPHLFFTPFHRLEFRTAFRMLVFRKSITLSELTNAFRLCDEDFAEGILAPTPLKWMDALREAERLGEAHQAEIGIRSGDLLHVASAVALGAREFLTFDKRQTDLARKAGLKVKTWRAR